MLIVKEKVSDKIKNWVLRFITLYPSERKRRKTFFEKMILTFESLDLPGNFSKEKDDWKKMFVDMYNFKSKSPSISYLENLFEGFAVEKLELIKESVNKDDYNAPIVVCTQKDNYIYLRKFLPYYRELGVKHFIFIDNNSSDESFHFLEGQDDVTLFKAPYPFKGMKKVGWKLQALSYVGLNHWCLWLDADEFLVYPEMEDIKLDKYVKILEKKGIQNVSGFMLDMYPSYKIFDETESSENFYEEYVYFDGDSDYYKLINGMLRGGMRGRCLNLYNLRLDKTPIIFYTKGNFPDGNHTTFPLRKDPINDFGCVLKHYKFLSSDKRKYQDFAKKDSGYWKADIQERYLDLTNMSVKSDDSLLYTDSTSIRVFPFIKDFIKE